MSYLDRTDTFMASLGFETYRVGGSVRDEILGRRVKDADYMVRGVPLHELGAALKEAASAYSRQNHKDVAGPAALWAIKPLILRDGRQAGWRVSIRGLGCIEVVLPRTEVSTGPGHRDFDIILGPNLTVRDDAVRRDFTFNALYRIISHPEGLSTLITGPNSEVHENILDPTGHGLHDLGRRQINVTHPDSFRDDPLRMLRALRFISTLNYDLGRETRALMALHAEHITGLTATGHMSGTVERELSKLLMGEAPGKALRVARDTGVLATVLPELAPMLGFEQGSRYHDMTTDEHTFTALETAAHVDAPLRVRWALLFHDSGKPETAWVGKDGRKHYYEPSDAVWESVKIMNTVGLGWTPDGCIPLERRKPVDHEVAGERIWREAAALLQVDNRLREDVATLIRHHMVPCQKVNKTKVRRARIRLGDELLRDLYLMRLCDLSGKGSKNRNFLHNIGLMEQERARCQETGVPASARELEINGHDLIEMGVKGRDIGRVLNIVLDEVACDPSSLKLGREWQLKRAEAAIR